jgi:hypothetical protein
VTRAGAKAPARGFFVAPGAAPADNGMGTGFPLDGRATGP